VTLNNEEDFSDNRPTRLYGLNKRDNQQVFKTDAKCTNIINNFINIIKT